MTDRQQQPSEPPTQPVVRHTDQTRRAEQRRTNPATGSPGAGHAGADLRPTLAPPELDSLTGEDRPGRWDWAHLTDTDAVYLADALNAFVAYFNDRYAWTREQTIPSCWAQHGALIEEMTTLMWSRWAAFQGPLAGPEAAQNWHTYHLPLFTARISSWIGLEAAADCRSGHHQPSRLVDPDRPYSTGRRPTTTRTTR